MRRIIVLVAVSLGLCAGQAQAAVARARRAGRHPHVGAGRQARLRDRRQESSPVAFTLRQAC